jgi:hypothetical protein
MFPPMQRNSSNPNLGWKIDGVLSQVSQLTLVFTYIGSYDGLWLITSRQLRASDHAIPAE